MASNPYTVEQHEQHEQPQNEPHNEEQREQREQLPQHFNDMPRNAQWLVLKHTGARFVVTHRYEEEPIQISLPYDMFWPHYVLVIVRYEFRLLPRRASGPEMIARFRLSLDPAIRQLPEWRNISAQHKAIFDRPGGYMAAEFEPFSQLKFKELRPSDNTYKLFCFLRRSGQPLETQPLETEFAPPWSKFDDQLLMEVLEKMQKVFLLPLCHM